jgi:hypothetical protein
MVVRIRFADTTSIWWRDAPDICPVAGQIPDLNCWTTGQIPVLKTAGYPAYMMAQSSWMISLKIKLLYNVSEMMIKMRYSNFLLENFHKIIF